MDNHNNPLNNSKKNNDELNNLLDEMYSLLRRNPVRNVYDDLFTIRLPIIDDKG